MSLTKDVSIAGVHFYNALMALLQFSVAKFQLYTIKYSIATDYAHHKIRRAAYSALHEILL